jgi:glycosyltransferase involved in cell wall biosynthesis
MISKTKKNILIDAREFVPGKLTGIGRVLEGLVDALGKADIIHEINIASSSFDAVPTTLKEKKRIKVIQVPQAFLSSEKLLSDLSKNGVDAFVSPYPKLPLFGCQCLSVHIIHDVLDLTHPAYRRGLKRFLDGFRLKSSLKKANLTWYDSSWSKEETKKFTGLTGENPRVRFPGVDASFTPERGNTHDKVLEEYKLKQGYILVLGNGLPHKNLGVLLKLSGQISRDFVFVGVSPKKQAYWNSQYPEVSATWIEHVLEKDLQSVIQGSFCLAQPSTAEGYGYPPLEAMASGVPAVVSNIPVLVETTGGNALKADPHDHREWLQALEALEKKEIYQSQIEKGLKWVQPLQGRRGWEDHISDLEELIKGSE